ncbi:zinc ABC transporter ATP-binding protein AztA [Mycobacterium sp.]|uniref:zinc ABC transporter ATP-binding protein AztA n=1 Tax=Mycobacterium sp. TaxID=1785 RepID=UPI002DAEFB64|nr:zinc ABC transporter ATP-binding protein AztA [Mycobacterium sp.]
MTIIFNWVRAVVVRSSINLEQVTFGYNGFRVFTDLTLALPAAATTAVVGPNGCGKSTLLELIAGVAAPEDGIVELGGREVALAVQRSQVGDAFPITVAEAVAMGRWRRLGLLRRASRSDRDIVDYWITELGLEELRHRRLGDLSGGQRQRILLAQVFAQQAPVVLLDEPTTALDADAADRVARQLRRLAASGTTIVAATHDFGFAGRFDHCVLLGGGRVVAAGLPVDVLTEPNLASAVSSRER